MYENGKHSSLVVSQLGSTLIEVLVTLGIVIGLMGVGVLSLNRGYLNLATAKQNLVNDLRRARMQATLKGAHFRFDSAGNSYTITRLADPDGDGAWDADQNFGVKVVELPGGFSVMASGPAVATAGAEFDSRGLLVPAVDGTLSIVSVVVSDGDGRSESLQIWPSGQVEADPSTAANSGPTFG